MTARVIYFPAASSDKPSDKATLRALLRADALRMARRVQQVHAIAPNDKHLRVRINMAYSMLERAANHAEGKSYRK